MSPPDHDTLVTGASALSAVLSIATGKRVVVTPEHLMQLAPVAKKVGHQLIDSIAIHAHGVLDRQKKE